MGARPVFRVHSSARILVAGQAPGIRVHRSGIPFDDPSGDRLREWMGIDRDTFYDERRIAIVPMGFCYPGTAERGDLPPLKRCARTWRQALLDQLPAIRLTLAVGLHAVHWHLADDKRSLTEIVRTQATSGDPVMPLPHPSPRNNIWLSKNRWFEAEVVPEIRARVAALLQA